MRTRPKPHLFESSIDWITVTVKSPSAVERLREFALTLVENQFGLGFFGKPWFQSGYAGVACGHVQFGERDDGAILRLGGYIADAYWTRAVELSENITRIDLQVTAQYDCDPALMVHRHYREIQRSRRRLKRAPRLSRINDADGGYTVYTGRRCSNVMGRIYDKERESMDERYKGCVRYEVQFNGKRAKWVALATLAHVHRSVDIARGVFEFFMSRGAALRRHLELTSSALSIDTACPTATKTDCARVLEWLRKSVSPSVKRLISRGLWTHVISALDLAQQDVIAAYGTG